MTPVRLVQLSRIYGRTLDDDASAAACIGAEPATLGRALFEEAAASDDVISNEAALSYLADRLEYFQGLVPAEAEWAVRVAFDEGLRSWSDD